MSDFTPQETEAWLLEKLRNSPEARPIGPGTSIQKDLMVEGDPSWDLVMDAVEQLVAEGRIVATPKSTMPSHGIPDGFLFVKFVQ